MSIVGALARIAFLTLPNYTMVALTTALEACRMANYVSGQDVYAWQIVTLNGEPAIASNGLQLSPTVKLAEAQPFDLLLVCGGIDVRHATDRRLTAALRRQARDGVTLGALCTGTFVLAEAGLLDGYRCAIHWENLPAVREEFPVIAIVDDLFVIDRDRITCTGGVAPLDLMLTLIAARLGPTIAAAVSAEFIMAKMRVASERQAPPSLPRQPTLALAARVMHANIETPLAIDHVADAAGVSARQLERLFKHHVGSRPGSYYTALRLDRARALLRQTDMAVTEIGLACGFQSPSYFSASYARHFGRSPRAERQAFA